MIGKNSASSGIQTQMASSTDQGTTHCTELPWLQYGWNSYLTLLHSERPKLYSFGLSECNRVNMPGVSQGTHIKCYFTRYIISFQKVLIQDQF